MINVNVIYILILAIKIYDVNPFVGIYIGCQYAYTPIERMDEYNIGLEGCDWHN